MGCHMGIYIICISLISVEVKHLSIKSVGHLESLFGDMPVQVVYHLECLMFCLCNSLYILCGSLLGLCDVSILPHLVA